MKRLTGLALLVGISTPALAVTGFLLDRVAVNTHAAQTFAVLPDGVRFPEGIALDAGTGNLFVATFDFGPNENQLLRYDSHGRLEAQKSFGPTPLLGMAINDFDGKLYLTNFGTGEVQRVEVGFGADSSVETVAALPSIGAPMERIEGNPDGSTDTIVFGANFSAPNAIAFDSAGTLYVSDSFQGAVFMASDVDTCTSNCTLELVVQDPLLATAGFPPFGANGLALSPDESTLFVANTGDDRVLAVDLASYSVSIFAESINGADGLAPSTAGGRSGRP